MKSIEKQTSKKLVKWIISIVLLLVVLIVVSLFSLTVGSSFMSITKVINILFQGSGSIEFSILTDIRLPRIMLGFAVGGALSLSGAILQGMFRNPLVEPYTLGIPGGAALGVCFNIVFGIRNSLGIISLPLSGFMGALLIIALVYRLSLKQGIIRINGLLLTGVMISFISSSLIMLIMAVSKIEDLHQIIFWIMGSLEEPSWLLIKTAVFVSVVCLFLSYLFCFHLNAFALGEEEAMHLGINPERTKRILFLISSLLVGMSVSVAGIIGFVGLVIPHFVRMYISGDHRILLASSFLAGSSFLILCDTLARTIIFPLELPVGVITGILGGTLFVYALGRRSFIWEK